MNEPSLNTHSEGVAVVTELFRKKCGALDLKRLQELVAALQKLPGDEIANILLSTR